jgi:hypothetical protein
MRRTILQFTILLILSGSAYAGDAHSSASTSLTFKSYRSQGWLVQETQSFRVFCSPNLAEAKRLPEACEALRRQLHDTWLGPGAADWSPRCDIVVHAGFSGYVRELGPDSRNSSGCATIAIDRGKVSKRRVDLRADAADWLTTALPHELTHVVLAARFSDQQIPRWADEGIAILAEPAARQAVRRTAMQKALARAPRFAAADLMSVRDYPVGDRRDAFYGQSASLVAYLIERDSPEKFLDFLEAGQRDGFEQALSEVYQIKSLTELDVRWRPQLLDRGASAELFAGRVSKIMAGAQID